MLMYHYRSFYIDSQYWFLSISVPTADKRNISCTLFFTKNRSEERPPIYFITLRLLLLFINDFNRSPAFCVKLDSSVPSAQNDTLWYCGHNHFHWHNHRIRPWLSVSHKYRVREYPHILYIHKHPHLLSGRMRPGTVPNSGLRRKNKERRNSCHNPDHPHSQRSVHKTTSFTLLLKCNIK